MVFLEVKLTRNWYAKLCAVITQCFCSMFDDVNRRRRRTATGLNVPNVIRSSSRCIYVFQRDKCTAKCIIQIRNSRLKYETVNGRNNEK